MVPDAEILCILTEALTALDIKDFTIKINHRKILDGIFGLCGVPADKVRFIRARQRHSFNPILASGNIDPDYIFCRR